jgi:hypothetical protein
MRHVLLLGAPATGTRRMVHPPAAARLVAPAGGALRVLPRLLCTAARTVDLAAVAAAADQHLSLAARAHKQPRCLRLGQCRTWTRAATGGILPRHACPARCGARRRYETWPLRSAPCLPIRQVVTAPSVRSNPTPRASARPHGAHQPVDMWTTQERCPHTHRPRNRSQLQFDHFTTAGFAVLPATSQKLPLRSSATASPRRCAIFARIRAAVHTWRPSAENRHWHVSPL